jgi:hypothetical protein
MISYDAAGKHLDIAGADTVEIEIRVDGTVMWVNTEHGCKLRICRIDGPITIIDHRNPQ